MRPIQLSCSSADLYVDRLWDGYSGGFRHRVKILIRNNRIAAVCEQGLAAQDKAEKELYLHGLTVLPGLIDAHVHLALDGIDFHGSLNRWNSRQTMKTVIGDLLKNTLESGIVAVRDGGDREGYNLIAKDWLSSGECCGPEVIATGSAVRRKDCYGSFLGEGSTDLSSLLAHIELQKSLGADQIKIIVTGLVTFRKLGEVGSLQFSQKELTAAVSFAHKMGLAVMAHANSPEGVNMALKAGVNTLEHGYFLTDDQLQELADRGIYWVPTVSPVGCQLQKEVREDKKAIIKETLSRQVEMIGKAFYKGVKIIIGTDSGASGTLHGSALFDELNYWQQAGLPREAILRSATIVAASALGLGNCLGQIRPGFRPCLLAVRGNPLLDLNVLRNLELIFYDKFEQGRNVLEDHCLLTAGINFNERERM